MDGWIKLHRKFNKWEWKDSPKHVAVFIDLLLNAQYENSKYRGVVVPAGTLTTSVGAIAKRTGVTSRGVRTVLKDLISTNEVTIKTTPKYSMISMVKWEDYQLGDKVSDNQTTNKRQTSDNLKEDKKEKKERNNINIYGPIGDFKSLGLDEILGTVSHKVQNNWIKIYGDVAKVKTELLKASNWLDSNPSKEYKSMSRFLSGWLSRANKRPTGDWDIQRKRNKSDHVRNLLENNPYA